MIEDIFIYFSGFFTYDYKFFNPVIWTFFISVFIYLIKQKECLIDYLRTPNLLQKLWDDKIFKIALLIVLFIVFTVILLVYQNIAIGLKYGLLNELVRHTFPYVFFAYLIVYLSQKKKDSLRKLAKEFINFNILLLVAETAYRVFARYYFHNEQGSFYFFKYDSFIYMDSNFTALHTLSIFTFLIFTQHILSVKFYCAKWLVLILLILLTFSRTAYLILPLILLIRYYRNINIKVKIAFVVLGIFFFGIALDKGFIERILEDESLLSKFCLFEEFFMFLKQEVATVLLGDGSGNLVDIIFLASHNLTGFIMEMGLAYFLFMSLLLGYIIKSFGIKTAVMLLPVFLSGIISLYPLAYMSLHFTSFTLFYFLKIEGKKHII